MRNNLQAALGSRVNVKSVVVRDVGDGYLYLTATVEDNLVSTTHRYTLTVEESLGLYYALGFWPELIQSEMQFIAEGLYE